LEKGVEDGSVNTTMSRLFYHRNKEEQLAIIKKNLPNHNADEILKKARTFSLWRAECCGMSSEWPDCDCTFSLYDWEKFPPKGFVLEDLFLCIEAIHGKVIR
jgi:hypothetical protein